MLHLLNKLLEVAFRYRVCFIYFRKWQKRRKLNPNLFRKRSSEAERNHRQYWSRFGVKPSLLSYRYYASVSGIDDPAYVPKELFYTRIERVLNDINYANIYSNKMLYDKLYGHVYFPKTVLRCIRGNFFDKNYLCLSEDNAAQKIKSTQTDIVVKNCVRSCGGHGVKVFKRNTSCSEELFSELRLEEYTLNKRDHFVFQEKLEQSEFTGNFNQGSFNTFRVMTLRLPAGEEKDKIIVLKTILRMGVGESFVDNESSGGISVGVFDDGSFSHYATSGTGEKYYKHPVSGVVFEGQQCLSIDKIHKLALEIAKTVPNLNLLSLDILLTKENDTKLIEVNTCGVSISFLQTYGGSLFGKHSETVFSYCFGKNAQQDTFEFLRTFY